MQEDPGDRNALPLSTAQTHAPVADDGVVAVGERRHIVVKIGMAHRRDEVGIPGFRPGDLEVLANGGVEQDGILGDDPDIAPQVAEEQAANVVTGDVNPAGVGVVVPQDQIGQGGFAGAGWPDDADEFAGLHIQGDVADRLQTVVGIAERDVSELDRGIGRRQPHALPAFGDPGLLVQERRNPPPGGGHTLVVGQVVRGVAEPAKVGQRDLDEGRDHARRCAPGLHFNHGDGEDGQDAEGAHEAPEIPRGSGGERDAEGALLKATVVEIAQPGEGRILGLDGADHAGAFQGLVNVLARPRGVGAVGGVGGMHGRGHEPLHDVERGREGQQHERQAPVEHEGRDQGRDDFKGREEALEHQQLNGEGHLAQVAGQALNQVAGHVAIEEVAVLAEQPGEEVAPDVVGHGDIGDLAKDAVDDDEAAMQELGGGDAKHGEDDGQPQAGGQGLVEEVADAQRDQGQEGDANQRGREPRQIDQRTPADIAEQQQQLSVSH